MVVLRAEDIAPLSVGTDKPTIFRIQIAQTAHRISLVSQYDIHEGDTVLEIGCGQGDCTTVLATAVGTSGRVIALDPASLDYGNPYTLGQAQSHISAGSLGSRISWVQADPITYLNNLPLPQGETKKFDLAVLANSLWYFTSPTQIKDTLSTLCRFAKRIAIAEYTLHASNEESKPHVLAALTQASLEVRKATSMSNIRTVVGPSAIKDIINSLDVHLQLLTEAVVVPEVGLWDGKWETVAVCGDEYAKEVLEVVKDEREKSVVMALREATIAAAKDIGGPKETRTMDVWTAVFSAGSAD